MHLFAKHPMPLLHDVFLAVASHHRTWQLVAGTGMSTQPGWTRSLAFYQGRALPGTELAQNRTG